MTVILGKLNKESDFIDANTGNIINPRTKEVISMPDDGYKPTPEEMKAMFSKTVVAEVAPMPVEESGKIYPVEESPLAAIIKAQVNKAVQEQIKSIDIGKMVADAIKESFK